MSHQQPPYDNVTLSEHEMSAFEEIERREKDVAERRPRARAKKAVMVIGSFVVVTVTMASLFFGDSEYLNPLTPFLGLTVIGYWLSKAQAVKNLLRKLTAQHPSQPKGK